MARNQVALAVTPDAWTELTNADVSSVSFQVLSGTAYIRYSTGTTPAVSDLGFLYAQGQGEAGKALTDLVAGTFDRVFARAATSYPTLVLIDHA